MKMKVKNDKVVRWTAWALLAAAMGVFGGPGAYAQIPAPAGSDVTASGATAAATPAQNRRAIRKADRLLAKQVRQALVHVKGLDSGRVVVVARSGAVTLGGSVPEAGQIDLAIAAAKGVRGVVDVTNGLSVKAAGQ